MLILFVFAGKNSCYFSLFFRLYYDNYLMSLSESRYYIFFKVQNIIYILLASWFCSRKKLKQTPDAAGIQEFSCFHTWKYFSHMQCVFFLIKKINKTKTVRSFPFPYWAACCVFVYFTKQKQTNIICLRLFCFVTSKFLNFSFYKQPTLLKHPWFLNASLKFKFNKPSLFK